MTSRTKGWRGMVMPTEPPQAWVIWNVGKLGIDLGDLAADVLADVARIVGGIGFAPAEQQPPVLRLAEIAHDET